MAELRTILIVLGILLVVGIYLADRIRRRRAARPPQDWHEIDDYSETAVSEEEMYPDALDEPHPDEWVGKAFTANRNDALDESQLDELKGLGSDEPPPEPTVDLSEAASPEPAAESAKPETPPAAPSEEVIVLTVLAQGRKKLRGPLLLKALQDCGLNHGDMDIFHYHVEGHDTPLFSVANVLEPGRFVLSEIAQLETPGVALFMQLPTVMPGSEALQLMLDKGRQLAAQLGAELCDGQRQPLDDEAAAALEKRAAAFTKQS